MSKSETKLLTLCMVYDEHRILLGMKKRGFGAGRWNGFGGKIQKDENIADAAMRELKEEAALVPHDMKARGILTFHFTDDPIALEVHLFSVHAFSGEPTESDEMHPQWFPHDTIPYDTMWPDDRYWLPHLLAGKHIRGEFFFKDTDTLLSHTLDLS